MAAGNFGLDNLCAILDYNHCQIDGNVEDIMDVHPIIDKYRAFNWNVVDIDGHDVDQILEAFQSAAEFKGRPTMIIANTIMGKGVSFMEGDHSWHGMPPSPEQGERALAELGTTLDEWTERLLAN